MNEEFVVDFEDPNTQTEKNDIVKDKDNSSRKSDFSLDISDPGELSENKSSKNKTKDDLDLSKKQEYLNQNNLNCEQETKLFNVELNLDEDKKNSEIKISLKNNTEDNYSKKKKGNEPYYFILKFQSDIALNNCLNDNFITLNESMMSFKDKIEVKRKF